MLQQKTKYHAVLRTEISRNLSLSIRETYVGCALNFLERKICHNIVLTLVNVPPYFLRHQGLISTIYFLINQM